MVSRASFLSRSLLSAFVLEYEATPPPPNLLPARFWNMILGTVLSEGMGVLADLVIHDCRILSSSLNEAYDLGSARP